MPTNRLSQHIHATTSVAVFPCGRGGSGSDSTGADIANIGQLDQKLWVALACPTRGIEFDSATLDLIDQDADGRIRAPELVQACEWAVSMVNDPDVLTSGSDVLQLASINESTEQGQALADEARRILALSGQEGAACVSLADVQGRLASLNAMPFNGDGILNPATLSDQPALSALVSRIMEAYGSAQGCDGQPGLGRAQLDNFFTDVQSLADWHTLASNNTCSLPTEAQAVAAVQALNAVQVKVEDFFCPHALGRFRCQGAGAHQPQRRRLRRAGHASAQRRKTQPSRLCPWRPWWPMVCCPWAVA